MDASKAQSQLVVCSQMDVTRGGVFLFIGVMILPISCQDQRQQVEVAFETFKGPMELWWDLYIVWIQSIQLKTMQVMFIGNMRKFTQLWQQKDGPNEDDVLQ